MYLKIKELRLKNNYTQTQLAKKIGVSLKSMSDYESEKADISLSKIIKLAEIFKCNVQELFNDYKILHNNHDQVKEPIPTYGINKLEVLDAKEEVIQSLKRENALLREMLDQAKSKHG